MHLAPYRQVLALPGVRSLMVLALLARIPITAIGVTMTLHVAQDLHRGWGAAGLVGAALTVGTALGGPLNGRFVDRRGLRPMLVVTTLAEAAFWSVAPFLAYPALLAGSVVAGVFSLPVFSVIRQSVAALVPAEHRRQAYALDSMSVELSFMAGPPLAVLLMSTLSGRTAMWSIGAALVLSGTALFVTNPPVREPSSAAGPSPSPVRRRDWLTPRFLAVCAAAAATTVVLAGTDLGIVATLRGADQVGLVGALLAVWGIYSLIGGFVYGALPRAVPLVALLAGLSLFTIPAGLVGHAWPLLFLTLLPAGVLCAPTLTASADLVSRLVPPSARGEAMGWHGSSLTVGLAIGSPLAGWAIDRGSPSWGFTAVGLLGAAIAAALLAFRHLDAPTAPSPDPAPSAAAPAGPAATAASPAPGAAAPSGAAAASPASPAPDASSPGTTASSRADDTSSPSATAAVFPAR
ncbi:MFS transporter [Dactylosporangium sp. NPDC051485]|uniref:MFS transporter n=1 Tax=Dactylosporangium sp. NPDC051485 TaxID=3154846 RepID=UPI00344757DF